MSSGELKQVTSQLIRDVFKVPLKSCDFGSSAAVVTHGFGITVDSTSVTPNSETFHQNKQKHYFLFPFRIIFLCLQLKTSQDKMTCDIT